MKKKIIFIGKTGSGKTTLCQRLNQLEIKYQKTQAVEFYDNAIDTPGEYLENRNYYSALIMSAVDADIIALIGDPTAEQNFIPPAFAGTFAKEVIGIITKINLVSEQKQQTNLLSKEAMAKSIAEVEEQLKGAGISRIFKVDTIDNVGVDELFKYLGNQ